MSLPYQPAVRIVLGFAARAEKPPATYVSAPTLALQKAVASMGKDWKRVAPMFVIAPAARSGRVVVGLAMSRAPVVLDAPRMIAPNTAVAKEHFIAPCHLGSAPDVDKYGNTQADAGILDALAAGANDPAIAALGLTLEDRDEEPAHFLVSDDGRVGALVCGQLIWRLGAPYEGGTVRTWSRDYGGGEGVRLVGVPYAEVGPDAPLVRIDSKRMALEAHHESTKAAVRALLDTQAAWSWALVSGDPPAEAAPIEPEAEAPPAKTRAKKKAAAKKKPALADRFVVRPFASCVSALSALGGGETELAAQAIDVAGIARAYSHEDLSSPPHHAPDPALYELREAPSAGVLGDPATSTPAAP